MDNHFSMSLGIQQSVDNIFSAIMIGGLDKNIPEQANIANKKVLISKECRGRFRADFPFNIFQDEYALFYEIFITLQVETFTPDQLKAIIDNNRDLVLDSPYINKDKYRVSVSGNIASDDDILEAIKEDTLDRFRELSLDIITEDEYKSSVITYTDWYKNQFSAYTAQCMAAIMSDAGLDVKLTGKRTRHMHGFDDMQEYYNNNMRVIKALSESDRIHSTVIDQAWYEEDAKTEHKQDLNSMFSIGIKEMDATIGDLRRGNMLGIMGPPKGGKTRFTNYLVQRALSLGYNVCVWPLEGTKEEWLAMQVSAFIARLSYEQTKSGKKEGMLRISSKDILQKKYLNSPTLRKEIAAAKMAISTGENYGRLSFIEGTAYVEDMFDILQAHYDNENRFDVLVIDQLVNVMSKKGKGKVERISEAYMETKNFIANKLKQPALGLMPAQLKQDVVDFLRRNPNETIDVTAGGESSETARTPDEVIGLFSSKEERDNNIMKIYSVASRHNGSFPDFQSRCYLECCFFTSEDDEIK